MALLPLLLAALVLLPLTSASPPLAAPPGVINGYCAGTSTVDPCPLDIVSSTSSLINSVSVTSYKLATTGLLEPCAQQTPGCAYPGDVEAFNRNLTRLANASVLVNPLVFDNDGNTIASFRAMLNHSHAQANIDYLVQAAVRLGYAGVSMDWEPSCWEARPSRCAWPTVAEADAYLAFLTRLAHALHAQRLPLTVCADHEVCNVPCNGDAYLQPCANDTWSMAQCNCCAFQAWFPAPALCRSPVDVISVMDTYEAPFNADRFARAVAPWTDAGCTPQRMSLGLLQNEANTTAQAAAMFAAVRAVGVTRVDIWDNPWTSKDVTGVWADSMRAFIGGSNSTTTATVPSRHSHLRGSQ